MKNKLVFIFTSIFTASMVIMPDTTEMGTKVALMMWLNSIIPVLLPFYIFSDFIKNIGVLQKLSPYVYSFVAAFLSGYPMGAKIVCDYLKEKRISFDEGKYILSYCFVTGPAFIIYTTGQFIGSAKGAVIVAFAHYIGAFLNSFLYKTGRKKTQRQEITINDNYFEIFADSIVVGFKTMALILAYLIVFNIIISMGDAFGLWQLVGNNSLSACLKGIMEMTVGINAVGMCMSSIETKIILSSMILSFGGLSVICQASSICFGSGIRSSDILQIKITHCIWSAIVATLITKIVVI